MKISCGSHLERVLRAWISYKRKLVVEMRVEVKNANFPDKIAENSDE